MLGVFNRLLSLFLPPSGFKLPSLKTNVGAFSTGLEALRRRMDNRLATQYALGHLHLRKGNAFDARMRFKHVLQKAPKDSVRFYLACALLQAGGAKLQKQGEALLRALASGESPYAREASFLLDESEGRDIPPSPPFSLVARYEQYAEKHPEDVRRQLTAEQAALLPLSEEERALPPRRRPTRESRLLYASDADERVYAEHLLNLLTEFRPAAEGETWLVVGDRYGHIRRYAAEKRLRCKVEYASPRLIIPEFVTAEDVARERIEEEEGTAIIEPKRISGYADPLLKVAGGYAAVLCPYLAGRYATPALPAGLLRPLTTPDAHFAFGSFTADSEEDEGFNLTAKMFLLTPESVRYTMEDEGAEYLKAKPFAPGGLSRGRLLNIYRFTERARKEAEPNA